MTNKKNEQLVKLSVELEFFYTVDLTEFNKQTLAVSEVEDKKKEFVLSKLPSEDKTKEIVMQCQNQLEELGYRNVSNHTYCSVPKEGAFLMEALNGALQEILQEAASKAE